jgi:hypothetical protein
MHAINGGCHCGNILVAVELPREPADYSPRACDCDFCRKHGAAYVSDAKGSLSVRIRDEREIGRYRQGGGLVDCIVCRNCGVLVGAFFARDGSLYGTVNVNAVGARSDFAPAEPVSPKTLTDKEKIARWTKIWFANVRMITST